MGHVKPNFHAPQRLSAKFSTECFFDVSIKVDQVANNKHLLNKK